VPRDAGPLWSRGFMRLASAAEADSRSPKPIKKDRCVPFGNWPKPPAETP